MDQDLIFPMTSDGKLDDRRDSHMWKQVLTKSGVKHYLRNQMHKTAFSNLYAELADIRKLLDYSGHSQVSTVMKS